ncbi:sulfurtransferase complex subunit TusC [Candidatus Pantoea edessiphila]|uniref:Sulfurtransferase complex subunit TusC n=1 Tax=Candidatus Pantoea edessiphila TaxID=2044610 RepID=A0A2P5T1T1_9GAMM|nr:sulfurtransferase complex subunit TusC [Candidatus Pantoea edessiphila]PPI88537.1 sulfurtransferase complex subunit TusC [Candidatus Pantoea edessiphila]
MNSIAFIFSHMPYGNSVGVEGLNAAIAISDLNTNIGIFFIGDGVLHLNSNQNPDLILGKNYSSTFYILKLYDIKKYFLCLDSLIQRGLSANQLNLLNVVKIVDSKTLRKNLNEYNHILTF